MDLQKEICEVLEENNIFVCGDDMTEQDGKMVTELHFTSNAGEDFVFTVWHDGTVDGFIDGFRQYAVDFDPEEHAEMWILNRGKVSGVPQSIRVLIDDADDIAEFLDDVSISLMNTQRR